MPACQVVHGYIAHNSQFYPADSSHHSNVCAPSIRQYSALLSTPPPPGAPKGQSCEDTLFENVLLLSTCQPYMYASLHVFIMFCVRLTCPHTTEMRRHNLNDFWLYQLDVYTSFNSQFKVGDVVVWHSSELTLRL